MVPLESARVFRSSVARHARTRRCSGLGLPANLSAAGQLLDSACRMDITGPRSVSFCRYCRTATRSVATVTTALVFFATLFGPTRGLHDTDLENSIADNDIIALNKGLSVHFGRQVFLDPERHLKIAVRPGDQCMVRVIQNDPLSQIPGRLSPSEFQCRFKFGEVQYSHFGSRMPPQDHVRLLLRYDSADDAIIVPFSLRIRVQVDQQEIVTKNMPLTVDKLKGLSGPVDSRILQLTYDREREVCRLTVIKGPGIALPRYGRLTDFNLPEDDEGMVDCQEFLGKNVRYWHTADGNGPNRDYVPFVVQLRDKDGKELKQEYFQLTVRMKQAKENTPPRVSDHSRLLMDVNQFVMTPITLDILNAEDAETPSGELVFNMTSLLGFSEGQIVSTDDRNMPITSFTKKDVEDIKIAYKPPAADSDVRRIFPVSIEVVDSEGAKSEQFTLLITVNPTMTLAPVVTRNTGISLLEGQSRRLHSFKNLEISDEDNLDDVVVTVADGLRHGQLLLINAPVKQFSPADLDAGLIRYQHDGSDTYTDNIVFRMTDGQHDVQFLFAVTIFPEDDEPPILTVNTGLTLQKNLEAEITPFVLSATDVDSDDDAIRFEMVDPEPLYGEVFLRQFSLLLPEGAVADKAAPEEWFQQDGLYEQPTRHWTQRDINEGHVYYRHLGRHHAQTVMDAITFRLLDDSDPPNVSKEKQFLVKILPLDDVPPQVHPNATLHLTVAEFELTEFTWESLHYTDNGDSDDRLLRYTITAPPRDLDVNSHSEAGRIVLSENPEVELTSFTQHQVNHRKVAYRPPPVELGLTPRVIRFEFQVEDEAGNVLPMQQFTVSLRPIDNKPPEVFNSGFRVFENGFATIDTGVLDAVDPDTDPHHLAFRLVAPPSYGVLQLHSATVNVGDFFQREDLLAGALAYVNGGAEQKRDQFLIEVSDGAHRVPATVHVSIRPVDDEAPKLLSASGGTLGIEMECPEGKSSVVDPEVLRASDSDTEERRLTFLVKVAPRFGEVQVDGRRSDRFTQEQLGKSLVRYQHRGGEIGRQAVHDSFNLTLSDMSNEWTVGGNRVHQIRVDVRIEPVDNAAPNVTLGTAYVVPEGQKIPIGGQHLRVTDVDSDVSDIVCTVLTQPMQGYLENVAPLSGSERERAGIPVTAFSVGDVHRGTVNYVQSIHWGNEPRNDRLVVQCSDGVNQSPRVVFPIAISPTNDERPQMLLRKFSVPEGMLLNIDQKVLSASDSDQPPDRLSFKVAKRPRHGKIVLQSSEGVTQIDQFDVEQLRGDGQGPTVAYYHDDSETLSDEFDLVLADGDPSHDDRQTITVSISPTDDEAPRLTINNGLDLDISETKLVTNRLLKAEDVDSLDGELLYVVRLAPRHGRLVRIDPENGDIRQNLTKGNNFTQEDIDNLSVAYVHTGQDGGRDLIKFDVTDRYNPLIDQYFYITIQGADFIHPDVVNKGVELPEGGRVVLTTDVLSTSDLNSADEDLIFTVTRTPSKGHLENVDQPDVPITAFTQLDLAGNKIRYVHTSVDEVKMDSFEFEVTDGFNSIYRTFRISLSDVDNQKPILFVGKLVVREGGHRVVTPFELKVEDYDTPEQNLRFDVIRVPLHGTLKYNRTRPISVFTMANVEENLISYQHDASETLKDSFTFVVTDGAHNQYFVYPNVARETRLPQTMEIEILPVDNGIPHMVINRGASTIGPLDNDINDALGFWLTNKVLKAQDRDSPNSELLYVITSLPKHGYLINRIFGNISITNFTQGDVDNMNIQYVFMKGSNATSDIFTFKVVDQGNNELQDQTFRLNWAWISLEYDSYSINETEMYLRVNLRRRGYLGETSFVGVSTTDITAKMGEDFHRSYAKQVQFNPGQAEAKWRIHILQDEYFERNQQFQISLEDPIMAVLEYPDSALVSILDDEDESVVFFAKSKYEVSEDVGELFIPIHRKGDLSAELKLYCITESGTATGTIPSTVLSFSDYISRSEEHTSAIRFEQNQDTVQCGIVIIDDSLYENDEKFHVRLKMLTGGRIGGLNETEVIILPDPNDAPSLYFGKSDYHVDESDGYVEVTVWRKGTDLTKSSSVVVQSKQSNPPSAEAGKDYLGVGRTLDFLPGVAQQKLRVTILDDLGWPKLEGLETFELILLIPVNAAIGEPHLVRVIINDTVSDLPTMQFREAKYTVLESEGKVITTIVRSGDLNHTSSVRCYTRQNSARVVHDFEERPDTNDSTITFFPGEREKTCKVLLVDDDIHEKDKDFRLVLGSPRSNAAGKALLGKQNFTRIYIKDSTDKPVIKFERTRFNVREPKQDGQVFAVAVPVVRDGDLSRTSIVRIHTKDGSAKSGEDYSGLSKELLFSPNISRLIVQVGILPDRDKEYREAFTVHLKSDKNAVAEIKDAKAIVYIQEDDVIADVTFPSAPMVVSLRDYDDVAASALRRPISGYPIVCITPCNPKHPHFDKTGTLCIKEGVNDSLTEFRWRVAAANGPDGVANPMKDVVSSTFITSTKMVTLDSIYFTAGSRAQCAARAVNMDGDPGTELLSPIVTISESEGICIPHVIGSFGGEPFTTKLCYTGPDDNKYPNMVKISVIVPHRDGMLPIISTSPLSNFALTLSPNGVRIGSHKCSNLLDFHEMTTQYGFVTPLTKNLNVIGEVEPYQYSGELRSEPTLRFYRNLDMESCMWEFVSYYDMSELVTECGGAINTDGQVLNLVQSYVSVKVPLYVSYVFYSPLTGGWQHNDMSSYMHLKFVYDTTILWEHGISSSDASELQGYLYPTSMRIRNDGRLVVNFRSDAKFRGQFLLSHPASELTSMVMSTQQEDLTFSLKLKRSEPTFTQPEQEWEFVSDYAVKDYSGIYHVKLLPCIVTEDAVYSSPIVCSPKEPIHFEMNIRFQQVSDPVAAKYSLNTQFHLMKRKELWLSNGSTGFGDNSDIAFQPDDTIYGRIMVDPLQYLGSSFYLTVEECYLCSGVDGYIPKYNPSFNEFGCIVESPNLMHSFKIIDRSAPSTVQKEFHNVEFNAILASEDNDQSVQVLVDQPGSDGFHMNSAPLFQVSQGRRWFIHCIYTIKSKENTARGIGKRSVMQDIYHQISPTSESRSAEEKQFLHSTDNIGSKGLGTNMHSIILKYNGGSSDQTVSNIFGDNTQDSSNEGGIEIGSNFISDSQLSRIPVILGVAISLLVIVVVVLILVKRHRNLSVPSNASLRMNGKPNNEQCKSELRNSIITVVDKTNGNFKVMVPKYCSDIQENTEV